MDLLSPSDTNLPFNCQMCLALGTRAQAADATNGKCIAGSNI